jgi:hypothetical protein
MTAVLLALADSDVLVAATTIFAAVVAVLWPTIQRVHRRRRLVGIIKRELAEMSPGSPKKQYPAWNVRVEKRFLHRDLVTNPAEHADLLLALHPDLAYVLAQLWSSYDAGDAEQFRHFLEELKKGEGKLKPVKSEGFVTAAHAWLVLPDLH